MLERKNIAAAPRLIYTNIFCYKRNWLEHKCGFLLHIKINMNYYFVVIIWGPAPWYNNWSNPSRGFSMHLRIYCRCKTKMYENTNRFTSGRLTLLIVAYESVCTIDISQYRRHFGFFLLDTDRVPFELLDSAALLWRESCGGGGQIVFLNFTTII
jgi:hypothetical protein